MHNFHYANVLIGTVLKDLSSLCVELKIPEPKLTLPKPLQIDRQEPDSQRPKEAIKKRTDSSGPE